MGQVYCTPAELAEEFQVSAEFVRRKAREGVWPSSRLGTAYRFSPEDREQIRELVKNPPERQVKPSNIRQLVEQLDNTSFSRATRGA